MSWGWGVFLFVVGAWVGFLLMACMAMSGRQSDLETLQELIEAWAADELVGDPDGVQE